MPLVGILLDPGPILLSSGWLERVIKDAMLRHINTVLIPLLAVLVLSASGRAQQDLGRYGWAMGLHDEFGFSDMAEKILEDMVATGTASEKIKGQLGLAKIRASQAMDAGTLAEKVKLLGEAEKLMKAAIDNWPDKSELDYFNAIFERVNVLQQRGELALGAVTRGEAPESDHEELRKTAEGDFGRAVKTLQEVRDKFENSSVDTDLQRWRIKNRAWYTLCHLSYNRALTYKKNGTARHQTLDAVSESLEEFILENDIDNFEAWVGSLYGTLLKAKVLAAKEYNDEAEAYFTAILDQVRMIGEQNGWDKKAAPPAVQAVLEKTYYELFTFSNGLGKYDRTIKFGSQMEESFKKTGLRYRKIGRAARVELAEAYFRTGEQNLALAISANITETGKGDASGILANRLIAEIIAVTPEKDQFRPEIILSAANGAWSQGRDGWEESAKYFRILLQVSSKIQNEQERLAAEAEAWFKIGYVAYDKERWLEAALTFQKGAETCYSVQKDGLGQKLIKYWAGSLGKAVRETNSRSIAALEDACARFQLKHQTTRGKGEILWDQAQKLEREAKSKKTVQAWEEAAAKYQETVDAGGPKKERAMAKVGRCTMRVAKILSKKDPAKAQQLLKQAKASFYAYLEFAEDPKNLLTDPELKAARRTALAVAAYYIADANDDLRRMTKDKAAITKFHEETVTVLEDFEKKYPEQRSLVTAGLFERLKANLALGNTAKAEADYRALKAHDPQATSTTSGGMLVAKAMRKPAYNSWAKMTGRRFNPADDEAWDAVAKKPGFEETRARLLESSQLFRDWLLSSDSAKADLANWVAVGWYFYQIRAWKESAEIHEKALAKFEGTSKIKEADADKLRGRLLVANERLITAAHKAGETEAAERITHATAKHCEALTAEGKSPHLSTLLLIARIYGGFVYRDQGFYRQVNGLGRFAEANEIWGKVYTREKARQRYDDDYWAALFYRYLTLVQARKAQRQPLTDIRNSLQRTRRVSPEMGGPKWAPLFDWMERQIR